MEVKQKKRYLTCCLLISSFIISLGCSSQRLLISAIDKHIAYEGRVVFKSNAAVLMWPGTSVAVNFVGTGISGLFKDSDTSNYYNVIVDKKRISKFHFDTVKKTYVLASNLPYGKHSLQLFKRTELYNGATWFFG